MYMWAYYGNHLGCSIQYNVTGEAENILKEVNYTCEYKDHKYMDSDELIDSLYNKGNEWKHENEYRAVYYQKNRAENIWNIIENNVFLIAKVTEVHFGLLAERNEKYITALENLRNYNMNRDKQEQIKVKKCMIQSNTYRLGWDKQYDYLRELEKLERKGK